MKYLFTLIILCSTLWSQPLEIALMLAPSVVGSYAQSTYNVAVATLTSSKIPFEVIRYDLPDESNASIIQTLEKIHNDGIYAILAPLTLTGVSNLPPINPDTILFVPTVHGHDRTIIEPNVILGGIDYQAQLQALVPYMSHTSAIFYGDSDVGKRLSTLTSTIASHAHKATSLYAVDPQGDKIVLYMNRASQFSKKSIITHLPIIKTSMLVSQLVFVGANETNILTTQIGFDPELFTLTQYPARKKMIVANSIIEQVPSIYETNTAMKNDLTFDWIQYTTSVGIDYLAASLVGIQRQYTLPIVNSQVIYPIKLMSPKESGFEPLSGH